MSTKEKVKIQEEIDSLQKKLEVKIQEEQNKTIKELSKSQKLIDFCKQHVKDREIENCPAAVVFGKNDHKAICRKLWPDITACPCQAVGADKVKEVMQKIIDAAEPDFFDTLKRGMRFLYVSGSSVTLYELDRKVGNDAWECLPSGSIGRNATNRCVKSGEYKFLNEGKFDFSKIKKGDYVWIEVDETKYVDRWNKVTPGWNKYTGSSFIGGAGFNSDSTYGGLPKYAQLHYSPPVKDKKFDEWKKKLFGNTVLNKNTKEMYQFEDDSVNLLWFKKTSDMSLVYFDVDTLEKDYQILNKGKFSLSKIIGGDYVWVEVDNKEYASSSWTVVTPGWQEYRSGRICTAVFNYDGTYNGLPKYAQLHYSPPVKDKKFDEWDKKLTGKKVLNKNTKEMFSYIGGDKHKKLLSFKDLKTGDYVSFTIDELKNNFQILKEGKFELSKIDKGEYVWAEVDKSKDKIDQYHVTTGWVIMKNKGDTYIGGAFFDEDGKYSGKNSKYAQLHYCPPEKKEKRGPGRPKKIKDEVKTETPKAKTEYRAGDVFKYKGEEDYRIIVNSSSGYHFAELGGSCYNGSCKPKSGKVTIKDLTTYPENYEYVGKFSEVFKKI